MTAVGDALCSRAGPRKYALVMEQRAKGQVTVDGDLEISGLPASDPLVTSARECLRTRVLPKLAAMRDEWPAFRTTTVVNCSE